jgi:hypothetical protein
MSLPVYSTGTVAITQYDTLVTLTGGIWTGINVKQGDFITIQGSPAILITEVVDDTHLRIGSAFPGATGSGYAYIVYQNYVGRVVGVAAAEDVGVMLEKLHVDGLPFIVGADETVPDPSYGDDGQLAFKPDTGQWWTKTGGVWVPTTYVQFRERLMADRIYYVRLDGNDANVGTGGGTDTAFKTPQHAWDVVCGLDFNGHKVTINIYPGTYTSGIANGLGMPLGVGRPDALVIQGIGTTPAETFFNCSLAGIGCFEFGYGECAEVKCNIKNLKVANSGAGGSGINVWGPGSYVMISAIDFGPCTHTHIGVYHGAILTSLHEYLYVSGGATFHWLIQTQGQIYLDACAYTLTGTPAFSYAWLLANDMANVMAGGMSFTGLASADTKKYMGVRLSNIFAGGAVFPGGVAGEVQSGAVFT